MMKVFASEINFFLAPDLALVIQQEWNECRLCREIESIEA